MAELLSDKNLVGGIVARMQVPYLTKSHQKVIHTVLDRHKKVYLFLGVDDRSDLEKNPFEYYFRKEMIETHFENATKEGRLVIVPLIDLNDNTEWVDMLDATIGRLAYPKNVTLYGGRDSFVSIYINNRGAFKTQDLSPEDYDSGTELRELVSSEELSYSVDVARAILVARKV